MKADAKAERLPRWKDCVVSAVAGSTIVAIALLARDTDAAIWISLRLGGLTALVLALTAVRQRRSSRNT